MKKFFTFVAAALCAGSMMAQLSLTEFLTQKPTEEVTLKDLTVIFATPAGTKSSTYVVDEDGVALVIYDASQAFYDGTLTAGKVLKGQKATYTQYKNQDEIIPTNTAEVLDGVAPVPTLLDAKPTDANVNRFVRFENVEAKANNGRYYIFEDVQLYGANAELKPTADGNYNVEGLYIVYNGNAPEIIVTGLAAATEGVENVAAQKAAVKKVENGVLVIEKNGVRYNATGAIVK